MKENFNPLVSVIIPVYNGANYMEEAIDSVLAQTYSNIEIVVVNDGSVDNTHEIAKSYGSKISYFKKGNGGVATALNMAIDKSNGEYISWLSHDDMYYPEKIEKQINRLSQLKKDERKKTVLYSNFCLMKEDSDVFYTKEFHHLHKPDKLSYPLYPVLNGLVHGCTLLVSKQRYKEFGGFDEKLIVTQDYDLWGRMFPSSNLIFMSDSLIKSRVHKEQGSKTIEIGGSERTRESINRIKTLTDEQKIEIGDSRLMFYEKAYKHFKKANYLETVHYIEDILNKFKNRKISKLKVSIIVPFYNRIDWVLESVQSVLEQTHSNFELILINDRSTEDLSKLKVVVDNDKRITLINNKRTKGAGGGRNSGIDIATGDFISFLDSDDLFTEEKLEKQLKFMVRNNHSFTHTSYILFSDNKDEEDKLMDSGSSNYSFPSIISGCAMATPTVMFDSDFFRNPQTRFPEKYPMGQDVCFWIKMTEITTCYGMMEPLAKVRKHDSNVAYSVVKQVKGLNNIHDYVITNFLSDKTSKDISLLNRKISKRLEEAYPNEQKTIKINQESKLVRSSLKQLSFLSIVKKVVKTKSKQLFMIISPVFRLLTVIKAMLNNSIKRISGIRRIISRGFENLKRSNKHLNLEIKELSKLVYFNNYKQNEKDKKLDETILKSVKTPIMDLQISFNQIKSDFIKKDFNVNLHGDIIYPIENNKSFTERYECSNSEFKDKIGKYIIKTDIVLDIGSGIKPQIFFTPEVHICVEPFKQYREVIKPYFPNYCNVISIKEDALKAMKVFDDNSVDTVFMLDLIEHLDKKEGFELIEEANRIARKQIAIYTPLGFYPMHFHEEEKDNWGLDGNDFQEHKSGWLPKDFDDSWDFHINIDCHEAFLPEEKKQGKKYSALMAIKTMDIEASLLKHKIPEFVKEMHKKRILERE